jgi:hypothetical protein
LGLTEAWRDRSDGAVFPLAPGVAGGEFNQTKTEFVNFTVDEVRADLCLFIDRIREVNPKCKVLLTISPVPLAATFEGQHVLVSTTYSKAVLRVAAEEVTRHYDNVIYFPSYEIITSPASGGIYFANDLRQVTEVGVRQVMKLFTKHFIENDSQRDIQSGAQTIIDLNKSADVLCDEETIEASLRLSGFS